MLKDTGNSPIY